MSKEKECHKHIEDSITITKLMQVRINIPVKIDVTNVVTPHMQRDLDVQPVNINARIATSLIILVSCATRKRVGIQERVKKTQSTSTDGW